MIQYQLYARADDLCRAIANNIIPSTEGQPTIVSPLYKREALSDVSDVFHDRNQHHNTRHGLTEFFKNFELRFSAAIAKFYTNRDSLRFLESLTALTLLDNANVDSSQLLCILAGAAPSEQSRNSQGEKEYFSQLVK